MSATPTRRFASVGQIAASACHSCERRGSLERAALRRHRARFCMGASHRMSRGLSWYGAANPFCGFSRLFIANRSGGC
jgi:hypothetical protein